MNRLDWTAPEQNKTPQHTESMRSALDRMADYVQERGDADLAVKFRELEAKLGKGLLTVAFCGHFSAGKSTLVNALCGASLLPSSPIPTSANVVTVVNGEPSARMTFRDRSGNVSLEREIPVQDLHGFAIDGEGVASIDVSYPVSILGDRMAIVDTPGVDSTDSAHRAATESALHLADVVFYVTDYNHVLSDVNFRFLRALAEWDKPTYVIVNQIDKHREEEVTFEAFREGLQQAMETWRIEPAGFLFLSLRQPDHPLSQWEELLSLLRKLQPMREVLTARSAERSARYLAEQFRETLYVRNREARELLQEQLGDAADTLAELAALREQLNRELEAVSSSSARKQDTIREELERLLSNANLTPAETRDKARDVLESLQPGFKVGWLAGAAKNEAERERRLAFLTDDVNRQITAHVNGHARELLRHAAHEAGWEGEAMEASLEEAFEPVSAEWLRSRVKPGMGADGQATLQYASEISSDIRSYYRRQALKWMEANLEPMWAPERERMEADLRRKLAELSVREQAAAALYELEAAERAETDRLLTLLPADSAAESAELPKPAALQTQPVSGIRASVEETSIEPTPQRPIAGPEFRLGASGGAAELLERAARVLSPLPALAKTADSLKATAARYRNKRFTIALFGAFSAGKSSFANALVGVPALPVSPNPTTATINRIVAPTEQFPDGSALVTMKTKEALLDDIRFSLRRLGIAQTNIDSAGDAAGELLSLAGKMSPDEVHPRGKPHLSFLRAALDGWSRYAELLGTRFRAEGEDYRRYAAEEQASCFVAEIDLFVDSPLTRGGAVLVDTPGADSINARHTGVAFEYIKNADAVLFVTYYNHAFTEADRQFLNQLGSVKDVFELDKMFFVINAADLAASESELQAVKDHVAGQLLKHGIRSPRLFGVSSLNGLQAKRAGNSELLASSGLAAFEQSFRRFAESELGGLATASARKEVERAGKQLDAWLQSASADAATREAQAKQLLQQAERWREQEGAELPAAAVQPLLQEAAEQLYHLRQRVRYRYTEHFKTAFHPSILQDDGRDLKKMLAACWDDLKRSVGEDLLQELRTSGLRLELLLRRTVEEKIAAAASTLAAQGFMAETPALPAIELPYVDPFADGPQMEIKRLWQSFKSPKHFFENDGSTALRDETADLLFRFADERLDRLKRQWDDKIQAWLQSSLTMAYAELSRDLASYAQSLGESMFRPEERQKLLEIQAEWRDIATEKTG
ncbi:dynamin [Cohnella pontilimi]|uniref:Dynamin n=1 Tax=Cohnella pontilimi TaxID=2564100 RepID=A0A4U0FH60_9BACL|nr:dynamin family protein [Cohnella pontilimi]TJY44281.1 dynamin [Cohnella pontilimi]